MFTVHTATVINLAFLCFLHKFALEFWTNHSCTIKIGISNVLAHCQYIIHSNRTLNNI